MPLKKIYDIFHFIVGQQRHFIHNNCYLLVGHNLPTEQIESFQRKLDFYCPGKQLKKSSSLRAFFSFSPVLLFGQEYLIGSRMDKLRFGIYNIDYRTNPGDGWEWCNLTELCSQFKTNINVSKQHFGKYISELKKENFKKCYIFGTGPSLEKALEKDWSDGYRVVCNTIVRDRPLWNHINPHIIVAGDAIYHFGSDSYAKAFRKDLTDRLRETNTLFVYPANFNAIVQRELCEFSDRLIPIPCGTLKSVHFDLTLHFSLPSLNNVLSLLLLPIGCTLSNHIYLWGFDGRAPTDSLFWANSKKDSYPEFLDELKLAHPAFFNYHVPSDNPNKYVNAVHGDELEQCLLAAEKEGFSFIMMHNSWTPTLKKRYSPVDK
jgi:hypothetical protein